MTAERDGDITSFEPTAGAAVGLATTTRRRSRSIEVSTLIARNPALVCDLLDITTRWNAIVEAT